jgi:hypothetical protein
VASVEELFRAVQLLPTGRRARVLFPEGASVSSPLHCLSLLRDPSSLLSSGYVERPGSDTGHSPRSSAEVKNGGVIPQLPHTSS